MSTIAPSWTDSGSAFISPKALTKGNILYQDAALDLRAVRGAWLTYGMAKFSSGVGTGSAAFTAGIAPRLRVFRNLNNDGLAGEEYRSIEIDLVSGFVKQVNNGSNYAAGVTSIAVDGTGTPAFDDVIAIWGVTAGPSNGDSLANLEFNKVSAYGSNTITLAQATKLAHNDNEIVSGKCSLGSIWLPGGAVYRGCFDYGGETATTYAIGVMAKYALCNGETLT